MGHKTMTLKNRNYKYVQGTQEQVENDYMKSTKIQTSSSKK